MKQRAPFSFGPLAVSLPISAWHPGRDPTPHPHYRWQYVPYGMRAAQCPPGTGPMPGFDPESPPSPQAEIAWLSIDDRENDHPIILPPSHMRRVAGSWWPKGRSPSTTRHPPVAQARRHNVPARREPGPQKQCRRFDSRPAPSWKSRVAEDRTGRQITIRSLLHLVGGTSLSLPRLQAGHALPQGETQTQAYG